MKQREWNCACHVNLPSCYAVFLRICEEKSLSRSEGRALRVELYCTEVESHRRATDVPTEY